MSKINWLFFWSYSIVLLIIGVIFQYTEFRLSIQYGTVNLHVTKIQAQTDRQKDTSILNKEAAIPGQVELSKADPAVIECQGLASFFYRKENGKCSPMQWKCYKQRRTVKSRSRCLYYVVKSTIFFSYNGFPFCISMLSQQH